MRTVSTLLIVGTIAVAMQINAASAAGTCESWRSRCISECPAAEKIGAPKGCTCAQRYGSCKQTGIWMSWDGKRSIQVSK
jgi:hypothetical protein